MSLESIVLKEHELLKNRYPELKIFSKEKYGFSVSGNINIIDPDNNRLWETYKVKIAIPHGFPKVVPSLFELSNKISRNADNHINTDGTCCLAPRVEEILILGKTYNLTDYIEKLVIPYLAGQKLRSFGEGWVNGEYAHFGEGIIEYYKEKLNTKDTPVVLDSLRILSGRRKNGRNVPCFCGSNNKYKHCHGKVLAIFAGIDRRVLEKDLTDIETSLKPIDAKTK